MFECFLIEGGKFFVGDAEGAVGCGGELFVCSENSPALVFSKADSFVVFLVMGAVFEEDFECTFGVDIVARFCFAVDGHHFPVRVKGNLLKACVAKVIAVKVCFCRRDEEGCFGWAAEDAVDVVFAAALDACVIAEDACFEK